jgi:hypothetical protein
MMPLSNDDEQRIRNQIDQADGTGLRPVTQRRLVGSYPPGLG